MNLSSQCLEEALKFKCSKSIHAFHYAYDVSLEESAIIFEDMIRFLWLSRNYKDLNLDDSVHSIDPAIIVIDEMWHTFILHTKEYIDFCVKYFGGYLHHEPNPKDKSSKKIYQLNEVELNELEASRRIKYSCIFDLFGEDVFRRWYLYYPTEYSSKQLLKRLKK